MGEETEVSSKIDRACETIKERATEWLSEKTGERPRLLIDDASREPYKPLQESKGPLNQIRIRTAGGNLVDLGERSRIVHAIEPFRLLRIYFAESDSVARTFVENTIREEGRDVVGNVAEA